MRDHGPRIEQLDVSGIQDSGFEESPKPIVRSAYSKTNLTERLHVRT
jgi:hypothetical protein